MSYSASVALQGAIYRHLLDDPALSDLIGDAVFDAMPTEAPSGPYISLGPEDARDAGDMTGRGSRHDFVISVLAGQDQSVGFHLVKRVAAAVSDSLESAAIELEHGHLAGIWFQRAKARRVENGAARRVDLTFRARIDLG